MNSSGQPTSPVTLIVAGGGGILLGTSLSASSGDGAALLGLLIVWVGGLVASVGVVAAGVRLGMAHDRIDHKPPPPPLVPRRDRD